MTRALLVTVALALAACEQPTPRPPSGARGPLAITDAYAPPAPAGGTGALFFSVAGGAEADTLLSVAFPVAERTEIHESVDAGDGMHGMRLVAGVPVPPGGQAALVPGGSHVMLINLSAALMPGDTLRAEATFTRAGAIPVVAVVRSLADLPHAAP